MRRTRILPLILCLLLLLPLLLACGETGKTTGTTATAAVSSSATPQGPDKDHDEIPADTNYGGEEVKMILRTYSERYSKEFLVEEETGDVVADEIFKRQLRVEQKLGITLTLVEDNYSTSNRAHGPWSAISRLITSGDADFDIVAGSNYNAQVQVAKGEYHNLLNIDNFHFDKNYYPKEVVNNMRIGDAMYTCTGDISTYLWDSLYVLFFNRRLCENNQMPANEIYNLVRTGDWTIDKLLEMTKNIYIDDNSDSKKSDGDIFGLGLLVSSATDGLYSACGLKIVDEVDGTLQVVLNQDKLSTIVDKFTSAAWTSNGVQPITELTSNATDSMPYYDQQFANGQYCFLTQILYNVSGSTFRNMADDYGIMPYPKYDKEQSTYNTYVHDQFTAFAIPVTVDSDRAEMVANVIEAMSSDGRQNVKPVYYNLALTGKYAKDTGSIEMLDTIFANITMDRGWIFGNALGGLAQKVLRNQILNNSGDLASTFQSAVEQANVKLATLCEAFETYKDN